MTHSAVSGVLVSINDFPASTLEQVYSGAVSVSAVDQTPTLIANAVAIPSDYVVAQMLTPMSAAGNFVSYSMDPFRNYNSPVVQTSTSMPMVAAIASTSTDPAPTNDEDEMDRLLDMFIY